MARNASLAFLALLWAVRLKRRVFDGEKTENRIWHTHRWSTNGSPCSAGRHGCASGGPVR
jgi:hypothetical protein